MNNKPSIQELNPKPFVVVAGKYEHVGDEGDGCSTNERNYKYISEPKSLDEALADLQNYAGYPFHEIEYTDPAGKVWVIDANMKEST